MEEFKSANELTKITAAKRLEMRDLLITHDVVGFREFVRSSDNIDAEEQRRIVGFTDGTLSELMYVLKSKQMYLGDSFQHARNYLRSKALVGTPLERTESKCMNCRYFRSGDEENQTPCMHAGALPEDVVCTGFTEAK